jgi:glycosyl transferase family 25
MNLTDCFDVIYIINLESRTDRLREVSAQLAKLSLGIDGQRIRHFSAVKPPDAGDFPTLGARGCFMSHLGILQACRAGGVKRVLILEDDAYFTADFAARFDSFSARLKTDAWSVFYGGWLSVTGEPPDAQRQTLAPDSGVIGSHMVGLQGGAIADAAAYLEAMLRRPAGDPAGGPMHVDGAYSWFRRAHPGRTTVIAVPPLSVQRPSRSDIHALPWFDRWPVLRELASLARRLKAARP